MAGRPYNSHRKKDVIIKDGPQLRQTKLVLRVTAKRLTYNTKNSIFKTHIEESTPILCGGNASESQSNAVPDVEQSTGSISTHNNELSLAQFKDPNSTPPGELSIRPKRNAFLKRSESCGLSWKEETELKKALYASLQRKKIKSEPVTKSVESNANMPDVLVQDIKKNLSGLESQSLEIFSQVSSRMNKKVNDSASILYNKSRNSGLFRAQRKFACGTKLVGYSLSNRRRFMKKVDCSIPDNSQNVPYTEDFIDYLCLRGTSFLPESLRFFDKIMCRNIENHLETPSSCSSTDFVPPPVGMTTRKTFHRKCSRTRKSSGLKNKEFRNEKSSRAVINRMLPYKSIEKRRPFTRSLTCKEAVDSSLAVDDRVVSIDRQEVDSSANYDFSADGDVGDDGDDDYDDDYDDDDGESEGLSEVLSCFVQDQQSLFCNVNSMVHHNDDLDGDDDDELGWMAEQQAKCDDPQGTHSDENLNPADGYCMEQSCDGNVSCKGYEGNNLFDDSDYDDDYEEEDELCLELVGKKVDGHELEDEMKCDANNNEIGTCFGAVNKCVGTDSTDFIHDSLYGSFSNHFQIVRDTNIEHSSATLSNINRCMLPKPPTNLPFIHPSFKCIIPDKVIHDGQVLLANVPVVSMTSLSSVLMIPPIQNMGVNFIQFSPQSMFTSWREDCQTGRNDLSSVVLNSSKILDLSTSFSSKDADNSQNLRKIAPKISVTRHSLEYTGPCLPCSSMNFHGDLTIQPIDGAQARASDISQNPLEEQNEVKKVGSFFRKSKKKPYWKKLMRIVHSNPDENLNVKNNEVKKELDDIPSTINLRSGKVITVEGPKKVQNSKDNIVDATMATSNISDQKKINDKMLPEESPANKIINKRNLSRKVFFGGLRRKRRRKGSIELIDRSWNRSGIKKCVTTIDGKSIRPVTRSRTLGDELIRPKINIDDYEDSL